MKSGSSIVLNSIQDKMDEIQQKIQSHKSRVLFIQQTKDRIEILNHEKQKQIFRIDNIIHEIDSRMSKMKLDKSKSNTFKHVMGRCENQISNLLNNI